MNEVRSQDQRPVGRGPLRDGQVWVAIVTAVSLLVQAVVARNVLDEQLDIVSQQAPLLVFIAYLLGGQRGRTAEVATSLVVVAVTAAVLLLYAY